MTTRTTGPDAAGPDTGATSDAAQESPRGAAGPVPAASGTARRGDLAAAWRLDGPVVAEVDLDAAPAAPAPRRDPFLLAATALAVLGLVGGSGLRSALSAPPAPTDPAVTAWAALRETSGPGGVDLLVTVAASGRGHVVSAVEVTGPRTAGPATVVAATSGNDPGGEPDRAAPGTVPAPLPLTVPADALATTVVRVPLACTGDAPAAAGLAVRVRIDGRAVPAVLVGGHADAEGLCRAAAAAAPAGSGDPLTVVSAQFDRDTAHLVVALPATATVEAVEAAGTPVRVDTGSRVVPGSGDGAPGVSRRTLVLGVPACAGPATLDGTAPVALLVRVTDGGRTADRPAVVGPGLARWLLGRSCG